MFDHLCLRRWPFVVVPDPNTCEFIADREQFRDDLEKLLTSLSRQNTSSIHPIWSWFGAGKTHTLYYLSNRATQIHNKGKGNFRTIYSEFPRNPRSFVDVYKSFSNRLNATTLSDAYMEITTSQEASRLEQDLKDTSFDLVRALNVLAIGAEADRDLAMRWIRAEALSPSDCRRLGISRKITSSEDSSQILIGLVRMFGFSASLQNQINSRLIWLLDELQRINQLQPRVRNEINTGLHSVFNGCPTGFSMIFSFSGQPTHTLPDWFSPELRDRIGRTRVMILPPMSTNDAFKFVKDVLEYSRRPEDDNIDSYFPFSEDACRTIINNIQENGELKPRAIMQTFRAVLEEADPLIEDGKIKIITSEFSERVLSELVQLD